MPCERGTCGNERGARASRSLWASGTAGVLGLLGVFLPKCPLCVAAYLCMFGVSASTALVLARLEWPLCCGLVGVSLLGAVLFARRSAHRVASGCAGGLAADAGRASGPRREPVR
jgi:hypothetical protein